MLMIEKEIKINNQTGLHARPAALLVEVANRYNAKLTISYGTKEANLKSIVSLMSLAVGTGEEVTIKGQGSDAQEAVDKISEIIKNDFTEE